MLVMTLLYLAPLSKCYWILSYPFSSCIFSLCRTSRFASFPEYLVLQIKKFTFGVDWVPKKLGKYLYSLMNLVPSYLMTNLSKYFVVL